MKKNSNLLWSTLIGAAAGFAVGMYVSSEKGQRDIAVANKRLKKLEKNVKKGLEEQMGKAEVNIDKLSAATQEQINSIKDQSQVYAQNGKEKVNNMAESTQQTAVDLAHTGLDKTIEQADRVKNTAQNLQEKLPPKSTDQAITNGKAKKKIEEAAHELTT